MGFSELVDWVLNLGIIEIPVWVLIGLLIFGAVVSLVAWRLRGYFDDGQISGLKAQLNAIQERLAVKDERLILAHDRQEELAQKLTVATDTIAQLQKQVSDGETSKVVAKTLEEVRLAIQSATTANTALGSSLAAPPVPAVLGRSFDRFTIYGPHKPEITASSQSKGDWPSGP